MGPDPRRIRARRWSKVPPIAEIALYAYTHTAHEGGFDLGRFPVVRAWLQRVAAQPGHIPLTQG